MITISKKEHQAFYFYLLNFIFNENLENGIFVMKMAQTYDRISLKNEQYKQGLNKFYSKLSSSSITADT